MHGNSGLGHRLHGCELVAGQPYCSCMAACPEYISSCVAIKYFVAQLPSLGLHSRVYSMVNSGGRKCGCSLGYKVWLLSRVYSMVDSGVEGCCILLPEKVMCVQFGKKKLR